MHFFSTFFRLSNYSLYFCIAFRQHDTSAMNTKTRIIICMSLAWLTCFYACQPNDEARASALVAEAQALVNQGQWRAANLLLDSVHSAYPREVTQRRAAKALQDSITYLEAKQTLAYSDSLLTTLLPQSDILLKHFRYEKNDRYEDHGRYVHRLLATGSNTSRNFLQAYVRDDRLTIVKSYYFGAAQVGQTSITLSADNEDSRYTGSNHSFNAEGWHEIMTLEDATALQLLNFVSTHQSARIRVRGEGDKPAKAWVYYLSDKEKTALTETYQLGFLMKDIRQLEQTIKVATAQINRYEQKQSPATAKEC